MHIRAGDFVTHQANDTFFTTVLRNVRTITEGYRVEIYLIGGIAGSNCAPAEYVSAVQAAIAAAWAGVSERVHLLVPTLPATDALRYMIQSDLLVGSGSSLPHVAAMLSGKTLFLNHEPKHDFVGVELMGDHVDIYKSGELIDSPRRVRIEFQRRMETRRPWDPCQALVKMGSTTAVRKRL